MKKVVCFMLAIIMMLSMTVITNEKILFAFLGDYFNLQYVRNCICRFR